MRLLNAQPNESTFKRLPPQFFPDITPETQEKMDSEALFREQLEDAEEWAQREVEKRL